MSKKDGDEQVRRLQLQMLRIQQGIWHHKQRAVIVFEGFDSAGKGGAIRRLTEILDPRGVRVHSIGAPECSEIGQHYLQRFWRRIPDIGRIAVFDRSWYGRVLVERVDELAPKKRIRQAYREINQFERMLKDDGIDIVKIFLAITKDEQKHRFKQRQKDPYKHWKYTEADVKARRQWSEYVRAADAMFEHCAEIDWKVIPANDKDFARVEVLRTVTRELRHHSRWMEKVAKS